VKADENYLGCHIHVDTLVSRTSQPEVIDLLDRFVIITGKTRVKENTYKWVSV
jgi:hypothetical protein